MDKRHVTTDLRQRIKDKRHETFVLRLSTFVIKKTLSPLFARPHPCIPPIGGYLGVVRSQGLQRRRRFFFSDYETTSFLDNGQHSFVLRLLIDKRKIHNSIVPTIHWLCPLVVQQSRGLVVLRNSVVPTVHRLCPLVVQQSRGLVVLRNSVVPTIHRLCPTCCLVVSWTSSLKELRSSDNSTGYRPPFVLRPLSLVRRNEALTHLKLHTELQHLRNNKWT